MDRDKIKDIGAALVAHGKDLLNVHVGDKTPKDDVKKQSPLNKKTLILAFMAKRLKKK